MKRSDDAKVGPGSGGARSRQLVARLAVPCIFVAGLVIARTTAAQDPPPPPPEAPPEAPEPTPEPSPEPPPPPPPPTESAPAPPPPAPSAPPPPPPPTATTPPPPPPPTATTPPPPPPATPRATSQPRTPAPPRATSAPPRTPPRAEPAPAAAPPAAPPPSEKKGDEEEDSGGLFGPIRLGPMVGTGLPNILSFGGQVKITRFIGVGVDIGMIPTVKVSMYGDATLNYQKYDLYGRLYPFGGMFFLGAGVGYETVKGKFEKSMTLSQIPDACSLVPAQYQSECSANSSTNAVLTSQGSVKTMVLTPQIGIFKTWGPGFSLGIDIGAQIPIAPSKVSATTEISVPGATQLQSQLNAYAKTTQQYKDNAEAVDSTLHKIGQQILPTINIRIGWLL